MSTPKSVSSSGSRAQVMRWVRWLAPVALLALLVTAFWEELDFLADSWRALRRAVTHAPGPIAGAVVAAFGAIVAMAAVMKILLNVDTQRTDMARTTALTLGSNAWSTTLPGGPALSAWLTYRVQRSWGASTGLCGWFFVISGALSTVWMALIGLAAVLFLGADLSAATLCTSIALTVLVIVAMFWATRHPALLIRWTRFLPGSVRGKVADVITQVSQIRMTAGQFFSSAFCSLCNRLLDVVVFYFCVWSVVGDAPGLHAELNRASLMGVTLAFIMTKLAGAAQVTPGGVGTVEAAAAASLVAAGMTLVDATAATLIYRIISFVLITAIGWVVHIVCYAGRGYMLGAPRD